MKKVIQAAVKKGKGRGRVHLTLETEDGEFSAWLSAMDVERLAASLLSCRFDLRSTVHLTPPPKWSRKPDDVFITFRTTRPIALGDRPSADFMQRIKDPAKRKQLEEKYGPAIEKAQAGWDKKAAKKSAKLKAKRERLVGGGFGSK